MSLSLTAYKAIMAQSTGQVPLFLIEFTHVDLVQPIRLVADEQDIVSNGNTYTAFPFSVILPDDQVGRVATTTLELCNVSLELVSQLDALTTYPELTLSLVLASSPDTLELGPAEYQVSGYGYNGTTISAALAFENINEELSPSRTINPSETPGAF
jgi:hypothetical protein